MIRLRKDNEKLKSQVEYWRGQTRYTKELTPREADVKKAAAELVQKYSSTVKPGEITGAVAEI